MELTSLRYFVSMASFGHMTKAAASLGVTQPALSSMLRKLEAEVGAALLHRTGRGVELTDAGRAFLPHAEAALRAAEEARAAVGQVMGLERGSIRLGGGATAITYLMPRAVSRFRREHPAVRFYVREAGSDAVARSVLAGELDLGVVTLPLSTPGGEDLLVRPWVEDELRLIVPSRSVLASKRTFRWSELAGESVVAFEAGSAVREVIDAAARAAGVPLNVVMELRSIESIRQMVGAGIGLGFVSSLALRAGEGLACRDGRLARRLALVRRRDRVPSAAVTAFEREMVRGRG
ncbi:MAG: LysR substrate-binding domain-containing protein [Planctomycetota bacterium]|nr:LysR substrate-binding domain-containing protein [Planctomycetota bacterium]